VEWLRRNYERAEIQNLGADVGIVVIRHDVS
jgi:hypothetical protein